jgi:hypothetical protein
VKDLEERYGNESGDRSRAGRCGSGVVRILPRRTVAHSWGDFRLTARPVFAESQALSFCGRFGRAVLVATLPKIKTRLL